MKAFVATALAGVACAMDASDFKFMQYIAQHGKSYFNVEEFNLRKGHFMLNDERIERHNSNPNETSSVGHNKFSDWSDDEYMSILNDVAPVYDENVEFAEVLPETPNGTKDWRNEGAVTGVKDQGGCGSCWAFSASGGLEGAWQIKSGQLISMSEQLSVDCVTTCSGCNGGAHL